METRPMMHTSRRPMKRPVQILILVLAIASLTPAFAIMPADGTGLCVDVNDGPGFSCPDGESLSGFTSVSGAGGWGSGCTGSVSAIVACIDANSGRTAETRGHRVLYGASNTTINIYNNCTTGSGLASFALSPNCEPAPPVCPSTTTATDFGFQSTNNGCYQNDAGCRIEPLNPNDSDVREVCIVDPNTGFASICTQGFDDATAPTPWRQTGGDCGNPDPNAEHELFAPYEERIEVDGQDNITPSNNPNCSEINGVQVCVGDSGCVNLPSGRTYCPPGVTPPQTDSEGEPIEYEQEGAWRTSTPNGDGTATESGGTINRNISGGNTGGGGDGNGDGGGTGGTGGNGDGDGDGEGECDPATEQCGDGTISGGGNCDNAPNCDGPPIECFIADQSWRTNCALTSSQEDINDALSAGLGTENDEGLIPVVGEVNVAEWFSSATSTSSGGCFSDVVIPISAMDTTLTLPLSMGCGLFDIIRFMLLAAASLWGLRHVAEAI